MSTSRQASRSAQSRFFAHVQDTVWYSQFLEPVVYALADLSPGARVGDIGTGPGKLLARLHRELALNCVGVDADLAMLGEAHKYLAGTNIELVHVPRGRALPFPPRSFDAICFCSLLYLLNADDAWEMLRQARTLLNPHGRIIILTASGARGTSRVRGSYHWSFTLWRHLTAESGRQWQARHLASDFAQQHEMRYVCTPVFARLANLEVLSAQ